MVAGVFPRTPMHLRLQCRVGLRGLTRCRATLDCAVARWLVPFHAHPCVKLLSPSGAVMAGVGLPASGLTWWLAPWGRKTVRAMDHSVRCGAYTSQASVLAITHSGSVVGRLIVSARHQGRRLGIRCAPRRCACTVQAQAASMARRDREQALLAPAPALPVEYE